MEGIERSFYDVCLSYDSADGQGLKGALLYKAFEGVKYHEELLAYFTTVKQKFDCLYAFLVTKTRIIEINAYSTMYIISSKKYKHISKVILEQDFEEKQVQHILHDAVQPERVQLKLSYFNSNNESEEAAWENIEDPKLVEQAQNFAKCLLNIQAMDA